MRVENASLNEVGLILGASATCDGANVTSRLRRLQELRPFLGEFAADLGCGVGAYTNHIRRNFCHTCAIDILPQNLALVKKNIADDQVMVVCASAEAVPLADASVDAVFLIEVLDHVPSVEQTLMEINRVLRTDGVCYLAVPNRFFPIETHPVKCFGRLVSPLWFPFLPWLPPLHKRLATARVFSPAGLKDFAEQCGLRITAIDHILPPLERRLRWMRPLLRAMDGTLFRRFGSSLLAILEKPGRS